MRTLPAVERERAAEPRAASDRPAGLVPIATSDTATAAQHENPRRIRYMPNAEDRRKARMCRMRRATHKGADLLTNAMHVGGFRWRPVMLTLTYREDGIWEPRQLSDLTKRMRQWAARRGVYLRLCWVAELTLRGRVHYHACIWLPRGLTLPKPDKQGWWPHGSTRIEQARRPISYMVKYTSKGEDSYRIRHDGSYERITFPKGCRIHGRSGLELAERRIVAWWCLPRYVREEFPEEGAHVIRAEGGGWVHVDSGEWMAAIEWLPP